MWESRSDFQGLWEANGKPGFGFPRFPWPVISTACSASSCATLVLQTGEELSLGILHRGCGHGIRCGSCGCGELIHSQIRAKKSRQPRQLPQNLPRCGIPAIDALLLALGRHGYFRYSTRPMKIQIRIEMLTIEPVEGFRMC